MTQNIIRVDYKSWLKKAKSNKEQFSEGQKEKRKSTGILGHNNNT